MKTLLIAVLSSIFFVSMIASPVSAQNGSLDGVYEISVSRVFLKGNGSTKRGTKQLMHVANVEVRGSSVRFLELTANNARAGRGAVFLGFQGNLSQSGVLSFSTRVSDALYNDERNNASILRATVPLKVPSKVGQTVAVSANDFNPRYGSHVTVKTLRLYAPSQSNLVASTQSSTTPSTPQTALRKNTRTQLKSVIQPSLAQLGYYEGAIDGIAGRQTDRAIAAFEKSIGVTSNGFLSQEEVGFLVSAANSQLEAALVSQTAESDATAEPIDSVQRLKAENDRLKLELENAQLRRELEAVKQQSGQNTKVDVEAVAKQTAPVPTPAPEAGSAILKGLNFDLSVEPAR